MTTTDEKRKRMIELGRKGGLALKDKKPPGYHAQLGRLGGIATALEHGGNLALARKRLAAGKKGAARAQEINAAGRAVLEMLR